MTEANSRATPHLVSRARAFLARGEPATAGIIAREVLGIHGAAPAVAERLVSSLLDGVVGFTRERGDLWSFTSRNSLMAESGVTITRPDLLVAGGSAARDAAGAIEHIEFAAGTFQPGVGAVAIERFRIRLAGDGEMRPGEFDDDGESAAGDHAGPLARFAARLAGVAMAAYRPREILDPIIDRLLVIHATSLEVDTISLARLARRITPDLTHKTLEELAAGLGLAHYVSARAEDQARLAGGVLSELLSRSAFTGPVTAEALLAFDGVAMEPRDFERFAFDEAWLAELPESPGIYRMYDAAGDLIYVGKAVSLRRRVLQYFRSAGPR